MPRFVHRAHAAVTDLLQQLVLTYRSQVRVFRLGDFGGQTAGRGCATPDRLGAGQRVLALGFLQILPMRNRRLEHPDE